MSERIAAVIPVLDEVDNIGGVVRGLLAADACCVLVVDGGSKDGSREMAAGAGAIVIREARRGYGRACLTGAEHANLDHHHAAIAFLDGDGSCDPAELPRLRAALDGADVVFGRRLAADVEAGALPLHARFGNDLVAMIISIRSGRRIHDLSPYKVVRTELLERLQLDATGYGWSVQLVSRASVDRRARLREVPVRFLRRRGGESKVAGRVVASAKAAVAMLRTGWTETTPRPVIAIVAKAPRPGSVKTRLIPLLGPHAAAELWRVSLRDTAAVVLVAADRLRATPLVIVRADEREEVLANIGPGWMVAVQRHPGLDGAICTAFESAAAAGAERALVVSGDNPDLPVAHLARALTDLDAADAVLGPTADGGYHLVGLRWRAVPRVPWIAPLLLGRLRRRVRSAFEVVPMGSGRALESTEMALHRDGWRVTHSLPWPDVDTPQDLRDLQARLAAAPASVAPRTRAWLDELARTPRVARSA